MSRKIFGLLFIGLACVSLASCKNKNNDFNLSAIEESFKDNMKDVASVRSKISISDKNILVFEEQRNVYITDRNQTDIAGDISITTTKLGDSFELEESIESSSFAAISIDTLFNVELNKLSNYKSDNDLITASLTKEQYKSIFNIDLDCNGNIDVAFKRNDNRILEFTSTYKTSTNRDASISVVYYYVHNNTDEKISVTFALEGGKCKESTKDIVHSYNKQNIHIFDPNDSIFGETNVTKPGYRIEGWYQNKNTNSDGSVTYSNRWDFSTMRVVEDMTLYARWVPITTYSYELFYTNNEGVLVSAGKYNVNEGQAFADNFKYASKITGYTALPGFYSDKDCTTYWNQDFKHPGGETNLVIPVYFKVIEGEYALVTTADELKAAAAAGKNIYLVNDIDFEEAYQDKEKKKTLSFDNYSGTFKGNGHTISNFNIVPQKSTGKASLNNDDAKLNLEDNESMNAIYYSIFASLDGAIISDVKFENVKMNFYASTPDKITNVFVAALAVTAKNSTITNVEYNVAFTIDPRTKAQWNIYHKENEKFYTDLGNNILTNIIGSATYEDLRGE